MPSRRYMLWVLCSIVLLAGKPLVADETANRANAEELKKFQGSWVFSSGELGGESIADVLKSWTVEVQGNKWKATLDGKREDDEEIELNPVKNPKEIDLVTVDAKGNRHVERAIYVFEGTTLKLCFNNPDKPRPVDFSTAGKTTHMLMVLKRK